MATIAVVVVAAMVVVVATTTAEVVVVAAVVATAGEISNDGVGIPLDFGGKLTFSNSTHFQSTFHN